MRTDRRTILKAGAAASAVAGAGVSSTVASAKQQTLLVYDSRIAESREFAALYAGQARRLDIAKGEENGWAGLRESLPTTLAVEGMTGWSDWIAVRGELEARGWRFQRDDHVAAPLSGKAHLFRWSLKHRSA